MIVEPRYSCLSDEVAYCSYQRVRTHVDIVGALNSMRCFKGE